MEIFGKKQHPAVIDNCDEKAIADCFATVFQSVSVPNFAQRHEQLSREFYQRFTSYNGNVLYSNIDVEMVYKCIHNMKVGKAPGIDGLSTEHITFPHH